MSSNKIEIIAEIAQGYEGNKKLGQLLALGAIRAEADAIKFQIVYADELATPDYHYYPLFKSLEMPKEVWKSLTSTAHQAGKRMYFDVYGEKSLQLAKELGADGIKVSTTEFYNAELVRKALRMEFSNVFISIGGIPIKDIHELIARESLKPESRLCFLFGFQAEPTPLENNNLLRIAALKKEFPGFAFGFMDHSLGTSEDAFYLPVLALATGISCIEKHISLDPLLEVEDYISALTPERFREFVQKIRKYEMALGTPRLELTPLEEEYRKKVVKVVVAREDLPAGTLLMREHLDLKRVSTAFKEAKTYNQMEGVVGKTLKRKTMKNAPIIEEIL